MSFLYLGSILFSTFGMLMLDRQYRLAFFFDWKRTASTLLVGLAVFLLWDIFGIHLDIFFDGGSPLTTGFMVAPDLPIEEFFFLTFLCYFALIVYRLLEKKWRRT